MNCKNCGFPLNGNQTCPSCGAVNDIAPVEQTQTQPIVEQVAQVAPAVEQTATSMQESVPSVEQPTVTSEPIPTAEPAPIESTPVTPVIEKKKNNTPLIIILIVLGLLLIGAGIFLVIKFVLPKAGVEIPIVDNGVSGKCGKANLDYYVIKEVAGKKVLWGLTDLGKKQETLVIPAEIDKFLGWKFTEGAVVKHVCFEDDDDVDLVSAFDKSQTIETIELPANLTHDFNMSDCPKLKEIAIPAEMTLIRSGGFKDDVSLKTVTFKGNKVTVIGDSAFKNCTSLESINLPDSVETIYSEAFAGCTSLKSITLPKSLTYMTNSSFSNSGIKTMIVPEELELSAWSKGDYRLNIEGCTVKVYKDSWADIHFEEVFGPGMTKEYISIK